MSKLIFREYIGVKPSSTNLHDFPTDIINSKISDFHFILGFASEGYENGKGNGIFKEAWDVEFFGLEKVKKLKENNPKVKVVISIGGRDVETPFDPAEEEIWIRQAVNSLKAIIQKYKNDSNPNRNLIDGIDINYQHIAESTTESLFSHCLGEVITKLKRDSDLNIDVVSIAPSEKNQSHYRRLYWDNAKMINWVDYQFYNQIKTISSPAEFVELYNNVANEYGPNKVLPGVSTDPDDTKNTKISRENFIAGCILLKQSSTLPGVFFWNANDSAVPLPGGKEGFLLERFWQSLVTE
ncbi:chitinase 2-like [Vicia villosa]|uniref:chitinase 2-like n=1 Tax=Vicia villosa TaxID=3911 RepID=UPI00273C0DCA|nr:chitinase 2-like [Vicia villosa]